jgi:hypothetical protein
MGLHLLVPALLVVGCGGKTSGGNTNLDGAVQGDAAWGDARVDAAPEPDGAASDGSVLQDGAPLADGDTADGAMSKDGAPTDGGSQTCSSNANCSATEYCAKTSCMAIAGTCSPRPTNCGNQQQVVCGCDGVNYFNECLAHLHGENVSAQGECGSGIAALCGPNPTWQCPNPAASCVYLLPGETQCNLIGGPGACWVTPAQCPISIDTTWRDCDDLTGVCRDLCNAIQTGGRYFTDNTCPI